MAGKKVKGYADIVRSLEPGEGVFVERDLAERLCREASRLARRDGWPGHLRRQKMEGYVKSNMRSVMRVF